MRFIFNACFLLLGITLFLIAFGLWFSLSNQPAVINSIKLSHENIARAKSLFKAHDPRKLAVESEQIVNLTADDLNLAANYLLKKYRLGGAFIEINPDLLNSLVTVTIPTLSFKQHVNIDLQLLDKNDNLSIQSLKIGDLPIPPRLAQYLFEYFIPKVYQSRQFQLVLTVIKKVSLQTNQIELTYRGNPELVAQAKTTLIPASEIDLMTIYHQKLVDLQTAGIGNSGSLTEVMAPLFRLAKQRSIKGNALAENMALLSMLGTWASEQDLYQFISASTQANSFRLTLNHRNDSAKHFLVSAALAARGDGALADAIGLFKEVSDSEEGSGFSFIDIVADRSGSRMGALAIRTRPDAHRVQAMFAMGVKESDIIPITDDLIENMNSQQFQQQFGHIGSDAYNLVMQEIERRLDSCVAYQEIES